MAKTYLWESVRVSRGLDLGPIPVLAEYPRMIGEDWAPGARLDRHMTLVATWAVCGALGPYPWCLNLWEHEGWEGLAEILMAQYQTRGQQAVDLDPALIGWFGRANEIRTFVRDRMLTPSAGTPELAALLARGTRSGLHYHEVVSVRRGGVGEYQARLHDGWQPIAERLGLSLVGSYRTELRDETESIDIWGLRDLAHWADFEEAVANDEAARRWRESVADLVTGVRTWLLLPHASSPLVTGRLP